MCDTRNAIPLLSTVRVNVILLCCMSAFYLLFGSSFQSLSILLVFNQNVGLAFLMCKVLKLQIIQFISLCHSHINLISVEYCHCTIVVLVVLKVQIVVFWLWHFIALNVMPVFWGNVLILCTFLLLTIISTSIYY